MLTTPTVASLSIEAVDPDGAPLVIQLAVGTPYECGTDEWACPIALGGLYDRLSDVSGGDAFQALCLASALVLDLLQDFTAKGGKLPDFPLESYAFGVAARVP